MDKRNMTELLHLIDGESRGQTNFMEAARSGTTATAWVRETAEEGQGTRDTIGATRSGARVQ
jgi:hypothetical protein